MKPSRSDIKEQITILGRPWGLSPMTSTLGTLLVAEEIPAVIPLTDDIAIVENVKRDITAISQDYPFSSILKQRGSRMKRTAALGAELTMLSEMKREQARKNKIDELYAEMTEDFRRANRTRIVMPR
jgi:hypothetical protein